VSKSFCVTACVAACLIAAPAFGGQPFSDNLAPTLSFGLHFGGSPSPNEASLHFTALVDLRSQLMRRDPELMRSALSSGESVDLTTVVAGVPLLTVFQLAGTPKGFDLARVLGHDMLAQSDQLNDAGDSGSGSSRTWIWWTAGAVAVGAIVGLAEHHSNNPSGGGGGGNNPPTCTVGNPVGTGCVVP
jgi:hypothetical protein